MKRLLPLIALLGITAPALAQDTAPITQVGDFHLDPVLTTVVGAGTGFIASPLTALLKKWTGSQGLTTQMIHAGLSVAITAGIGYSQGAYGPGWQGVGQMLLSAGAAFITGIGFYTMQKQSTKGALK